MANSKPKQHTTRPKKPVAKPAKAGSQSAVSQSSRQLKLPRYASFRLRKRIKHERHTLPGSFRLFGRSLQLLQRHWKLFLGISAVYAVLNLVLVHGLADSGNVQSIKTSLDEALKGKGGQFASGLTVFAYLLGGSNNANSATANGGVYQTLNIILVSLAVVWALRQVYSNAAATVRVRDSFYKGMYPFVPFILVLLMIGLQLLPLVLGGLLYGTVISNGIAVYAIEKIAWGLAFFLLALTSLYMLASSVFALYVVTLPDMTPMKALRSARELVRYRRWLVLRKVLFLPFALVALMALIMLPVILWLTPVAVVMYFVLTIVSLPVIHCYMYALYRELLK
jgi:hypothetical protein